MKIRARSIRASLAVAALAGLWLMVGALAASPGKPVKVFLCAGQSNMAGAGNRNGLDGADARLFPDPAVRFWFASPGRDNASSLALHRQRIRGDGPPFRPRLP